MDNQGTPGYWGIFCPECKLFMIWLHSQRWRSPNLEIFFQTSTPPPTEFVNAPPPPENVSFDLDPLIPPLQVILQEECGSICQWLQLVESDSPLYRSNKQETFFFLFGMNNMHHTRKWSQKRNTSIRSWMILKFWNIWSLVFCGQLIQTSFYPGILVICTGGPEIGSVSRRLWNNPRELAYMIPYFP